MSFFRPSGRPKPVECFFCLSVSLLPPSQIIGGRKGKGRAQDGAVGSEWNWQCGQCGCWNVKDEAGQMVSDLPAMHSTQLNSTSFSMKGQPSTSHLPSVSTGRSSSFCESCITNQTLIMNLLANYLPEESDPTYADLCDDLRAYTAGLRVRYPPVCERCAPGVQDALEKSYHRGQSAVLGSALRRGQTTTSSKASGRPRRGQTGSLGWFEVLVWRLRGFAWILGFVLIGLQGTVRFAPETTLLYVDRLSREHRNLLLWFHAVSILWIAWDPYWLKRASGRGRVRLEGRSTWVRNMRFILLGRLAITVRALVLKDRVDAINRATFHLIGCGVELSLLLHALTKIRIIQTVQLNLVRPVSTTDLLSNSLDKKDEKTSRPELESNTKPSPNHQSSNPQTGSPAHGPDFPHPRQRSGERMEWEPSPPRRNTLSPTQVSADLNDDLIEDEPGENDEETGLENLLASWRLGPSPDTWQPDRVSAGSNGQKGHEGEDLYTSRKTSSRHGRPRQNMTDPHSRWTPLYMAGIVLLLVRLFGSVGLLIPSNINFGLFDFVPKTTVTLGKWDAVLFLVEWALQFTRLVRRLLWDENTSLLFNGQTFMVFIRSVLVCEQVWGPRIIPWIARLDSGLELSLLTTEPRWEWMKWTVGFVLDAVGFWTPA